MLLCTVQTFVLYALACSWRLLNKNRAPLPEIILSKRVHHHKLTSQMSIFLMMLRHCQARGREEKQSKGKPGVKVENDTGVRPTGTSRTLYQRAWVKTQHKHTHNTIAVTLKLHVLVQVKYGGRAPPRPSSPPRNETHLCVSTVDQKGQTERWLRPLSSDDRVFRSGPRWTRVWCCVLSISRHQLPVRVFISCHRGGLPSGIAPDSRCAILKKTQTANI